MNNRLLLLLAAAIVLAAYFAQKASHNIALHSDAPPQETASAASGFGGDFSLVDQHGTPYTQADLKGHWSLVFFGFSHCPDMCPMALTHITAALDSMPEAQAARITPVLITVDPARDTPAVLKEYAAAFHPRLVALTGAADAVAQAAAGFKVYHQKTGGETDYMVNHSGFIYVMDAEGRYIRHFSFDDSPETIARGMATLLAAEARPEEQPF